MHRFMAVLAGCSARHPQLGGLQEPAGLRPALLRFFHPRLPGEPLIFVEVALIDHMANSITPPLDEQAAVSDLGMATTAIFYSPPCRRFPGSGVG